MAITYETNAEGDLIFSADEESKSDLLEMLDDKDRGYPAALMYLQEEVCGNGLEALASEEIDALTDAPIFGEDVSRDEDGAVTEIGAIWWFPNYQVTDELRELAENGLLLFSRAPELARPVVPSVP